MRRTIRLAILFLGIILIAVFLLNDYLPPRTPIKVARIHSGLKIPKSSVVIDFKEDYAFTGEGQVEVKLRIAQTEIEDMKKECLKSGFKKLTIDRLINDRFLDSNPQLGFNMPNADLRNIKNGLYRLNATNLEKLDFTMIVLNLDNSELCIWTLIP